MLRKEVIIQTVTEKPGIWSRTVIAVYHRPVHKIVVKVTHEYEVEL